MKKSLIFMMLCAFLVGCQSHNGKYNHAVYRFQNVKANSLNGDDDGDDDYKIANPKLKAGSYASITQNPWKFIQTQINVKVPDNKRILAEKARILRNPEAFETIALRSEPYVYYIINQLHQNNLPIELALIPLIESAYDPLATSPAKAAGLWQFVPITAREYGLKQNSSFDARRDLIESTTSAMSLLKNLNSRFDGDWLLTLAAYNSGEGRVRKAIAQNQAKGLPTNYWALDLPKETMQYVPKILAIIDIVKNNRSYGINLPTCSYENSLVRIDISKNISLNKIAKYAGIPLNDLISFNAGYVKHTVNGPFHLLIPYVYAENLYQKLQADNLVSNEIVELLQDVPHKQLPFAIKATNIKYNNISNEEINSYAKSANSRNQITYLVKAGDNLSSIAQSYRVKITDILQWNNLKNSKIKEGDTLTINVASTNPI